MSFRISTILTVIVSLAACTQGKHPFLIAQLCMTDRTELRLLRQDLIQIAHDENMTIIDNTSNARQSLEAMGANNTANIDVAQVTDLHLAQPDGLGLGVGNQGLPEGQFAIGFSEGDRPAEARAFASRVIDKLRRRWRVTIVPDNEGARPMEGCQRLV
jgi:hypothetical protein